MTAIAESPTAQLASPVSFQAGKSGVYRDIPLRDYLALDAVGSSILKAMRRSPAHALALRQEPKWSDAPMIGDAVHLRALQPELFRGRYAPALQCSALTKDGKGPRCSREGVSWCEGEQYCAQHTDWSLHTDEPTILNETQYNGVCLMADSVTAHPTAAMLLEADGDVELSLVWTDVHTGVLCKARLDKHAMSLNAIADLKTTTDAGPEKFSRTIFDYGYEIQGAHYLNGCVALGIPATTFGIIAVEKEPPYCVAVYELEPEAVALGYEQAQRAMKLYAQCKERDAFPGYPLEINRIGVPVWARDQINRKA